MVLIEKYYKFSKINLNEMLQSDIKETNEKIQVETNNLLEVYMDEVLPYFESIQEYSEYDLEINGGIFSVTGAVGGDEAWFFAEELFNNYCHYADNKDWQYDELNRSNIDPKAAEAAKKDNAGKKDVKLISQGDSTTDKSFKLKFYGDEPYDYLSREIGVHRVQRVPCNSDFIQTSTVEIRMEPTFSFKQQNSGIFSSNKLDLLRKV